MTMIFKNIYAISQNTRTSPKVPSDIVMYFFIRLTDFIVLSSFFFVVYVIRELKVTTNLSVYLSPLRKPNFLPSVSPGS